MAKTKAPPWAIKLRAHMRATHQRVRDLAPQLGIVESTLRSWLNGTRTPDPQQFIELVRKARADISQIANGGSTGTETVEGMILNAWHFGDDATKDYLQAIAESHARRSGAQRKSHK